MASTPKRGNARKNTSQNMIDLDFVRGLIEAIDGSGIDSLEITRAGTRIRVSKSPPPAAAGGAAPQITHYAAAPAPAAPPVAAAAPAAGGAESGGAAAAPKKEESKSHLTEVTSPMVGTFYRAPSPEAPPYVEVGTQVRKGQTLCILEAMKLMNELESEVDGVVKEILVSNTEPVEYGQPLFLIDPNG